MTAAASAYDAVAIRDGVAALGLPVEIDHSPVWGSPHKHVYAFLSDRRWDGPLIHISPQEELETGHGIYVASRASMDDTEAAADVVDDLDELMAWVEDRKGSADGLDEFRRLEGERAALGLPAPGDSHGEHTDALIAARRRGKQ